MLCAVAAPQIAFDIPTPRCIHGPYSGGKIPGIFLPTLFSIQCTGMVLSVLLAIKNDALTMRFCSVVYIPLPRSTISAPLCHFLIFSVHNIQTMISMRINTPLKITCSTVVLYGSMIYGIDKIIPKQSPPFPWTPQPLSSGKTHLEMQHQVVLPSPETFRLRLEDWTINQSQHMARHDVTVNSHTVRAQHVLSLSNDH